MVLYALIDFEQLKIENQTLNEKIEERNEELLKLRKKTTTTVQVLTHLKEKLQFVHAENQVRKHELSDFEVELTSKRDVLTQVGVAPTTDLSHYRWLAREPCSRAVLPRAGEA